MGTHPIFESDFDCLTEMNRLGAGTARLSLRLGQRPVLAQTSKRTAFDMGTFSCGYRWAAYSDPAIAMMGHCVFGFFWVYYLYNCWNHSEHHLCHVGFPNPLGEATELATGHYVGFKGMGTVGARFKFLDDIHGGRGNILKLQFLNEELGLPSELAAAPAAEGEEDEEGEGTPMGALLKKMGFGHHEYH